MDLPVFIRSIFHSSSAPIMDLDPSAHHRLSPPPPTHPMSLFIHEEEVAAAGDDSAGHDIHNSGGRGNKCCASPWQRMKWTDDVVCLLISLVASIGDDAISAVGTKLKLSSALQKKGKWKMVSKLMMRKGCFVSPQQCEDKFNDLNKRYKRLNEILGRRTSFQVVQNPSLLDSMPHISQKAKDDVRRILSSKHLFYREMCAFHNGQRIPNSHGIDVHHSNLANEGLFKCGDTHEEDGEKGDDVEDEDYDDVTSNDLSNRGYDKLRAEVNLVFQDLTKPQCEERVWIRKRLLQLQQERVGIQAEAFELEKRQLRWRKFCSKKDRELKGMRLENERLRLENESMLIQVKHKELELDSMSPGKLENGGACCCSSGGGNIRPQTGGRLQKCGLLLCGHNSLCEEVLELPPGSSL